MGISINWIKKYIDFDWEPEELGHKLTMAGIAVEGVEKKDHDWIMELDLTPNRGDCLGLINLAREIAALNGNKVKIPEAIVKETGKDIKNSIKIEIAAPDLCLRYAARLIKNCEIKPSPVWMQEALLHSGVRPINNIVDVTNYVLLETNQPLHAFDYHLLGAEKQILVRRAFSGEKITTLDGLERQLNDEMLVITDGQKPIALAGIMGGENTEISANTTDVLLESASFLATNIRKTSRKLALRSDSSIRFEKGSDINGVIYAVDRAAQLIQELAGGEIAQGVYDVYPKKAKPKKVTLRNKRVNYLLDTKLKKKQIKNYLANLGFKLKENGDELIVDVPTYRPDIQIEVDLIEEVARLHGYHNIPARLPYGETTPGGLTSYQLFREEIRTKMARNLNETITYSFINRAAFDKLMLPADSPLRRVVKVANPLSEEQGVMRTFLLPGLLEVISRNWARKNQNIALFEIGSVFYPVPGKLPEDPLILGAITTGSNEVNWLNTKITMDFYYLKGIIENLFRELGIKKYSFIEIKRMPYHPGRAAAIMQEGKEIGTIGEIHPSILESYDIKDQACACEINLEELYKLAQGNAEIMEITKFPGVQRDIALLIDVDIKADEVLRTIKAAEKDILQDITIFDIYRGEQVPAGYKGMGLKLTFESAEKTLTDADVNNSIDKILANLQAETKAVLR